MRVAIFSDVHGNIYSFERILNSMKKNNIEYYIYCGDICGYYYYQNEIIELLRKMNNLICIMGNHDQMFVNLINNKKKLLDYDVNKYGNSNRMLLKNITYKNKLYIQNLNSSYEGIIDNKKVGIFHASPFNSLEEYVYPTSTFDRFKRLDYDFIFLGHTHYSMYKKLSNTIIINPGSCGQPRNGKVPSYAIWETSTNNVEFIYVDYDFLKLVTDVEKYDKSNKYLIDILYRGR